MALACGNHPGTVTQVSLQSDFAGVRHGGCSLPCDHLLDCGHRCRMICHRSPHDDKARCTQPCERVRPAGCQHKCPQICYACALSARGQRGAREGERGGGRGIACSGLADGATLRQADGGLLGFQGDDDNGEDEVAKTHCPPCRLPVDTHLSACGHVVPLPCCDAYLVATGALAPRCPFTVTITLPGCKHTVSTTCGAVQAGEPLPKCKRRVRVVWECCGHAAEVVCGDVRQQDGSLQLPPCKQPCKESMNGCGHACAHKCSDDHGHEQEACAQACSTELVCRHICQAGCGKPHSRQCERPCNLVCCHGLICSRKCHRPCIPCKEPCPWRCRHYQCSRRCYDVCDRPPCNLRCPLALPKCGHRCFGLCGEGPCPPCPLCDAKVRGVVDLLSLTPLGELFEEYRDQEDEARARHSDLVNSTRQAGKPGRGGRGRGRGRGKGESVVPPQGVTTRSKGKAAAGARQAKGATRVLPSDQLLYQLPECGHVFLVGTLDHYVASECHGKEGEAGAAETGSGSGGSSRGTGSGNDSSSGGAGASSGRAAGDAAPTAVKLLQCPQCRTRVLTAMRYNGYIKRMLCLYNRIKKKMAGVVTAQEMAMVVAAMAGDQGMSIAQGHWFVCPKGHPYFIGNCGGAQERARCPECKAFIGGSQYQLEAGNRFVNLDGAANPAWDQPGMRAGIPIAAPELPRGTSFRRVDILANERDPLLREHFDWVARHMRQVLPATHILRVELVLNPTLMAAYQSKKELLFDAGYPEELLMWHGTAATNLESIVRQGLLIGGQGVPVRHGTALGTGVYLGGDPTTALGYANCGAILFCRTLLGKSTAVPHDRSSGAHSYFNNNIAVVFSTDQVLPCYIVHC
eukprot:jgi/Mesvir1/4487/Mv25489-RA.1